MAKGPVSELTVIPGVGSNMAAHLNALGIERVDDLKGKDPEALTPRSASCRGVPWTAVCSTCTGWRWPMPRAVSKVPNN